MCVQKQDHGLDSGLDVELIPLCRAALPDDGHDPQPVYLEMPVVNTHRWVGGWGTALLQWVTNHW